MDGQERPLLRFLCRYKEMKPPGGGISLDGKNSNAELTAATTERQGVTERQERQGVRPYI
ncbi:MAG: hypothetical protein ACJAWL_001874 [Motiliproteus sp.]|jgi:hypothetical protein